MNEPGNLRDRIAAALQSADRRLALEDEMPIGLYYAHLADAVIRELGLQQEDGECGYCHAQLPGCRYVTECETNDD